MTEFDKISTATFEAWQHANTAQFHFLIAYRFGEQGNARLARQELKKAVAALDAVLADQPAPISVEA